MPAIIADAAGRRGAGPYNARRRQRVGEETVLGEASYPVSVVIATTTGWPRMRRSVDAVLPQVRAHGGQLVVADSSGVAPPAFAADRDIAWLERPGASVVGLRREGYALADGEIVAATEDHCRPADDWLERVLMAHAAAPDVAAIGGAVENGSRDHDIDWAIYFITQLSWMAPLARDEERVVGHTNVSYKRAALAQMPMEGPLTIEILFNAHLRNLGQRVIADDSIRVRHYQCMGPRRTSSLEFHNGRTIGGLRRQRMAGADWLRAAAPPIVAGYRMLRTVRLGREKRVERELLLSALPWVAWLHLVHAVGESIGYVAGPGDSPSRLH